MVSLVNMRRNSLGSVQSLLSSAFLSGRSGVIVSDLRPVDQLGPLSCLFFRPESSLGSRLLWSSIGRYRWKFFVAFYCGRYLSVLPPLSGLFFFFFLSPPGLSQLVSLSVLSCCVTPHSPFLFFSSPVGYFSSVFFPSCRPRPFLRRRPRPSVESVNPGRPRGDFPLDCTRSKKGLNENPPWYSRGSSPVFLRLGR